MIAQDSAVDRCELALARALVYRVLAGCFRHPDKAWRAAWPSLIAELRRAGEVCCEQAGAPAELLDAIDALRALDLSALDVAGEHARVLGHTPRASAVPYETEWCGAAGELLQYHQIADVFAFYAAFGVELGQGCDERADHVTVELEFNHFLCVKEAWAEEQELADLADLCRGAESSFVAEHLATWIPGLCQRLQAASDGGFYARAAALLKLWIQDESRRLDAPPRRVQSAPSLTTYRPEDACFSCGRASACFPPAPSESSHDGDPLRG